MKRRSFFRSLAALALAPRAILLAVEKIPALSMVPARSVTEDPFEAFRLATEKLPASLYARGSYESMWTGFVNRGEWPNGAGETKRLVLYK